MEFSIIDFDTTFGKITIAVFARNISNRSFSHFFGDSDLKCKGTNSGKYVFYFCYKAQS